MRNTWKLFWGFGFILLAAALVLDAFGVFAPLLSIFGEISVWAIIGGLLLLCFALSELIKGNIGNFFFPLALIFMIFEKNIAILFDIGDENGNIINNWLLLLVSVLLGIGFSILFSGVKRRKRRRKNGCAWSCGEGMKIRGSVGSSVRYIDCDGFKFEEVENNLGSCTVFFENEDKYEGGGVLSVDNNLGSMVITVPEEWHIVVRVDNSLGSVNIPKHNGQGAVLTITGDNNLGSIIIKTSKREQQEAPKEENASEE